MWVFLCIKYSRLFKHFIERKPLIFWRVKKHQLTIFQIKICCCILTASWQQFTVNKINSKKVANFGHSFQNYITYIFFTRFLYTYTCIKSTKNKDNNFFFTCKFFWVDLVVYCVQWTKMVLYWLDWQSTRTLVLKKFLKTV